MTNIPVSASAKTYFSGGTQAKATQAYSDADKGFSDILKNQKGSVKEDITKTAQNPVNEGKAKAEKLSGKETSQGTTPKENVSGETVREDVTKDVTKDAGADLQEKVTEAADEMLKKTAEELGISEDELLSVLQSLFMTPADLLQTDGLKEVLLSVSGEEDFAGFITNEQLFTSYRNLTENLDQTVSEVALATGLSETEVEELFRDFLQNPEGVETVEEVEQETAGPVKENNREVYLTGSGKEEDLQATGKETVSVAGVDDKKETGRNANDFADSQTNVFAQKMQTQQTESIQPAESVYEYFDTDTENILRQITDYMRGQVTDGVSEMEIQLHPASLGTLHIHLISKEGVLTAQFTAQNETVKAALESQMVTLQDTFREQGITVESIEVMVSSHKFEQSYEEAENSTGNGNGQPGRHKARRITSITMDNEELTEEEILAKEVLMASGSTVEYMA